MELQNEYRKFAQFPEHEHFMVFAVGSEMCLKAEFLSKSDPLVVAALPDLCDPLQFWELKLRNPEKRKYSIVNVSCQLAIEVDRFGAVLLRPPTSQQNQQFFMAYPQRGDDRGYIVRSTYEQEKALCLYGALQFREVDPKALNFIFRFEQQQKDHITRSSTLFTNSKTKRAMEAVRSRKGTTLVEATIHGKFSQRWFIKHIRHGWFQIQNVENRLNVDSHGAKHAVGLCSPNTSGGQLWSFQAVEESLYRVKSYQTKDKLLGVADGHISLVNPEDPTSYWLLDGRRPGQQIQRPVFSHTNLLFNAFNNMLEANRPPPRAPSNQPILPSHEKSTMPDARFQSPPPQLSTQFTNIRASQQRPPKTYYTPMVYQSEHLPAQLNYNQPAAGRLIHQPVIQHLAPSRAATTNSESRLHDTSIHIPPPSYDPELQGLRRPQQISHIRLSPADTPFGYPRNPN